MTSGPARAAFDALQAALASDLEEGVAADGDMLTVHGAEFARLDGDDLLVLLPDERAADLTDRGVAEDAGRSDSGAARLRVTDAELWRELAEEAHDFVGEPAVGRDS